MQLRSFRGIPISFEQLISLLGFREGPVVGEPNEFTFPQVAAACRSYEGNGSSNNFSPVRFFQHLRECLKPPDYGPRTRGVFAQICGARDVLAKASRVCEELRHVHDFDAFRERAAEMGSEEGVEFTPELVQLMFDRREEFSNGRTDGAGAER